MKQFAARMKIAETVLPRAVRYMHRLWTPRDSRSQPKIHSPMKVDSRKNATSASSASGAPKMSPTNREYSDQFIPNWNSCTIPVTTPAAKLMRKSLLKNLVSRSHSSFFERSQRVSMAATSQAVPMVMGTKKK